MRRSSCLDSSHNEFDSPRILLEQSSLPRRIFLTWASPTVYLQVNLVVHKHYPLFLQQLSLSLRAGSFANLPLRIDDALPRHVIRTGRHGPAHPAWAECLVFLKFNSRGWREHLSDFSVGDHLSIRNLPDQIPHLFVIGLLARR